MHSDAKSGEKPYILGLHCDHGIRLLDEVRHLNERHLAEKSQDNRSGIVFKRQLFLLGGESANDQLRDSRLVEFILPGGRSKWKIETLQMEIVPDNGDELLVVKNGLIEVKGQIAGNNTDDWTIRVNAKSFAAGALLINASCTDVQGKVHSWQADYVDVDDVELSCLGQDGKRDDQNFLDDVAQPVKAFLEDPQHARSDGTLLKDHILFIVVSYGLPRSAVAPCGIARGVTDQINDFGSIIDFGQRIQLLYYDQDKMLGQQIRGYHFAGNGPFSDYFLRSPQAWPLFGKANPFIHSQLYSDKASYSQGVQPLPYTSENRRRYSEQFLYFVSRIDAPDPLQAKALIDRAVYATSYAGSSMGTLPEQKYDQARKRVGVLKRSKAGIMLWEYGYRHLYYGGQGKNLLEWWHLAPDDGFLNDKITYLPGGISATVISHNGWKNGEMIQDLKRGVTATVGAARVYRGAPHIHNKSWWDDDIFYPALLQGKTLGESWLMNQIHLGWITTFVGDPLMAFPQKISLPDQPLQFDPNHDVVIRAIENAQGNDDIWLQVKLNSTAASPNVAQLQAVSENGEKFVSPTFDSLPTVCLGGTSVCGQRWSLTLMDPFGQEFKSDVVVRCNKD
ncbi:MAG: hypothetical protein B6I37_06070 [Desulfobacteraceae bacterium 4572_35.2]|nr:MAG: hypothetical protein B6I37_06070 [Desulfobacteraceae bacterium 4572_35.2]